MREQRPNMMSKWPHAPPASAPALTARTTIELYLKGTGGANDGRSIISLWLPEEGVAILIGQRRKDHQGWCGGVDVDAGTGRWLPW